MKQLVLPLLLQRMSHLTSVSPRAKVMTLRPARPGTMMDERSSPWDGNGVSEFMKVDLPEPLRPKNMMRCRPARKAGEKSTSSSLRPVPSSRPR